MHSGQEQQFCSLQLSTFFQRAYECKIKVVGAIKEIFQHKKYIVQLYLDDQPALRCLKRYTQFEALHQVIHMNFKNIDLGMGEFPSKFQVMNRQETRRSYFQQMLNKITMIFLQKMTNQTNRRLLSTLYVFLVGNQPKTQQKIIKAELSASPKDQNVSKLSQNSMNSRSSQDFNKKYESAHLQEHFQDMKKKQLHKVQEKLKLPFIFENSNAALGQDKQLRLFMATQFLIKFQDERDWKERYLKLENSCLLIYKHKNDNNFKSKIELFQAKIECLRRKKNVFDHFCQKMQLDNEPKFPEDTSILTLSHQHDFKKLMIIVKEGSPLTLAKVKQILSKASRSQLITDFEGVFNPIGKLFIILHSLKFTKGNPKTLPIVYLRIKTSGLVYETKRMTFSFNTSLSIRQTFIIPISNAFANVFLEVIMIQNDGIIRHESQQKCIGVHKISFSDYFSYPSGYGLQRVHAKLGKQVDQSQVYGGILQLSAINYSHISSIYADSYANQNDGVIMSGLKSTSDTDQLVITVDRVLRLIGNIALFITAFWRNVYLFKYPRMSYTFFVLLILLFNFGSAFSYFRLFLYSFLIAMFYHLPFSRKIIVSFLDIYVFKYIHPKFKMPLCIFGNQLKFLQWTTNLTAIKKDFRLTGNGKLQKTQEAKDKKFEQWSFVVHGKTYNVVQQCPSFLEKVFQIKKIVQLVFRMISAAVNTLQKAFNILSWADRRRSIIIFWILFFIANVANTYIFQIIGTIFCIHRLYKGIKFYQNRHYVNNRKLAVYCLRYIINLKFNYLITNPQKYITSVNQLQIEKDFNALLFPLRDQGKLKLLKDSIEHVLGVYIDIEELGKGELKQKDGKSAFALIEIVTIIQTCEARLKLEWISGQQGISDQFQELKILTKEELVIDLWVQSLLINFFLNVPSQLYTTFRPVRSKESLKLYKDQEEGNLKFKRINI